MWAYKYFWCLRFHRAYLLQNHPYSLHVFSSYFGGQSLHVTIVPTGGDPWCGEARLPWPWPLTTSQHHLGAPMVEDGLRCKNTECSPIVTSIYFDIHTIFREVTRKSPFLLKVHKHWLKDSSKNTESNNNICFRSRHVQIPQEVLQPRLQQVEVGPEGDQAGPPAGLRASHQVKTFAREVYC